MKHEDITERVIAAFYHVYNTLGWGFLERVDQGALVIELRKRGLTVEPSAKIIVYYEDTPVGEYFADLLIEGVVMVELKAADYIASEHESQLINHLKATDVDVGLILNFGPKAQVKRKVFETARRRSRVFLRDDTSTLSSV